MSISGWINNVKLWDGNNWECILNLTNVYKIGYLFSACFLKIKNKINNSSNLDILESINNNVKSNLIDEDYYILVSNRNHLGNGEEIKMYDLKGKEIKKIKDSNDNTCFIDTYIEKGKEYDNNDNYYILTGNSCYVKSYNYKYNKL